LAAINAAVNRALRARRASMSASDSPRDQALAQHRLIDRQQQHQQVG
jgi:hypothetical protein